MLEAVSYYKPRASQRQSLPCERQHELYVFLNEQVEHLAQPYHRLPAHVSVPSRFVHGRDPFFRGSSEHSGSAQHKVTPVEEVSHAVCSSVKRNVRPSISEADKANFVTPSAGTVVAFKYLSSDWLSGQATSP